MVIHLGLTAICLIDQRDEFMRDTLAQFAIGVTRLRHISSTANTLPGCNTLWKCRLCGREDLHVGSGQARERVILLLCTIFGGVEGKGKEG